MIHVDTLKNHSDCVNSNAFCLFFFQNASSDQQGQQEAQQRLVRACIYCTFSSVMFTLQSTSVSLYMTKQEQESFIFPKDSSVRSITQCYRHFVCDVPTDLTDFVCRIGLVAQIVLYLRIHSNDFCICVSQGSRHEKLYIGSSS